MPPPPTPSSSLKKPKSVSSNISNRSQPLTTRSPLTMRSALPSIATKDKTNDTSIWLKMDERLQKQSEFITNLLSAKVSETEAKIVQKLDQQIPELEGAVGLLKDKSSSLESSVLCNKSDIEALQLEIKNIKDSLMNANNSPNVSKDFLNEKATELCEIKTEFEYVKAMTKSINDHENRSVACDAILFGVPHFAGENLLAMFHTLCATLQIHPPNLQNIFRSPPKSDYEDSGIVIKFFTPYERNTVIKYAEIFRKTTKQQLCSYHVGINSGNAIYLHECLTHLNLQIMQAAMKFKKSRQLAYVYTSRGMVYVKRWTTDEPQRIESLQHLDMVAGIPTNEQQCSSYN